MTKSTRKAVYNSMRVSVRVSCSCVSISSEGSVYTFVYTYITKLANASICLLNTDCIAQQGLKLQQLASLQFIRMPLAAMQFVCRVVLTFVNQ
jgi:hypothetical protein